MNRRDARGPDRRTLTSAALVAIALPPWDVEPALFVALVPWLGAVVDRKTLVGALWQGFWLSLVVALLSSYWLAVAVHEFAGFSWALSVLTLLLYAAFGSQPQFLAFGVLVWLVVGRTRLLERNVFAAMACGLAYVGIEEVLPRLFDVGLGVGLHQAVGLRQLAELGGVDLLTWLVVTVNLLLWQTFARMRTGATSDLRAAVPAIVALVLVVSGMGYGLIRFAQLEAATASAPETLAVAIIQGSVPNQTRLAWARGNDEAAELQLGRYLTLTEPTVGREVDLIVWPEATFPGIFGQPKSRGGLDRANRFDRFVLKLDTPIVFGAYDLDREQDGASLFNAVFSIEPDPRARRRGDIGRVQRYHKHLLLPFAESLPGFLNRVGIRRLLPGLGAFARGPGVRLLPIERGEGRFVRLVPILCSESLSTLHALEGARLGGHLLLNVGSDGWFGNLGEPEFHLAISRFRSIETRLPQIRSANSGISGLILPSGEVRGQTEIGEQQRVEFEIGLLDSSPTPVVRWGNWFGRWAIGASALFGIALFVFYRRRS